jgi:hypothetical protein
MVRTLQIGQPACYWSDGAAKPLPALTIDCDGEGNATLAVFTAAGGRFTKMAGPKNAPRGAGWTEVGQDVIG